MFYYVFLLSAGTITSTITLVDMTIVVMMMIEGKSIMMGLEDTMIITGMRSTITAGNNPILIILTNTTLMDNTIIMLTIHENSMTPGIVFLTTRIFKKLILPQYFKSIQKSDLFQIPNSK